MSAVIDLSRMQSSRGRLPFLLRGQDGRITRAKTRNDFERELDQIRATGSAQERPDSQLLAALACWRDFQYLHADCGTAMSDRRKLSLLTPAVHV